MAVFYRVGERCPHCGGILHATYEPDQTACDNCGFSWDDMTQKPVHDLAFPEDFKGHDHEGFRDSPALPDQSLTAAHDYLEKLRNREFDSNETVFLDGRDEQGRSFGSQEDSSIMDPST